QLTGEQDCNRLRVQFEHGECASYCPQQVKPMNSRQSEIVDLLQKAERLEVWRLAQRFEVSQMTIRRDLRLLEEQGFLVRTHGGGIPAGKLRFLQSAFPHYAVSPQKAGIGKLAASLIAPGETLMIEAG